MRNTLKKILTLTFVVIFIFSSFFLKTNKTLAQVSGLSLTYDSLTATSVKITASGGNAGDPIVINLYKYSTNHTIFHPPTGNINSSNGTLPFMKQFTGLTAGQEYIAWAWTPGETNVAINHIATPVFKFTTGGQSGFTVNTMTVGTTDATIRATGLPIGTSVDFVLYNTDGTVKETKTNVIVHAVSGGEDRASYTFTGLTPNTSYKAQVSALINNVLQNIQTQTFTTNSTTTENFTVSENLNGGTGLQISVTGLIDGTIVDLTLTNTQTSTNLKTVTVTTADNKGYYYFGQLNNGNYKVTAKTPDGRTKEVSFQVTAALTPLSPPGNPQTSYSLLAPLPGVGTQNCTNVTGADGNTTQVCSNIIDTAKGADNPCPFGSYLNTLINLFIGFCAVLAFIMIVVGGIEYMTSELISSKESGRSKITGAVLGLLVALGAYALLNTLNPQLLNICSIENAPVATVVIGGENTTVPFVSIDKTKLTSLGILCPTPVNPPTTELDKINQLISIGASFSGKATYSMVKRNTFDSSKPTAYFDCSSYVAQVYKCAGFNAPGNNTGDIFGSDPITVIGTKVNNVELKVGDLLGWKAGGGEPYGHVVMYVGGGQVIDAQGPPEIINQTVKTRSLDSLRSRINRIKLRP